MLNEGIIAMCALFGVLLRNGAAAPECQPGWSRYHRNSVCYRVNPRRLTWSQAETECVASGGRLAGIGDEYENQFVYQVSKAANLSTGTVWLGRVGKAQKGAAFEWNDATTSHFHGFKSPEQSPSTQCVTMWLDLGRADGSWQPWDCGYNGYASVCKRAASKAGGLSNNGQPRSHVSTRCCLPSTHCSLRCPAGEKCVPDDLNCLTAQCPNATGWCLPRS
ncbi:unnamed protein product, partial [Mesorhabditis spiculigera]